MIDLGRWRPDVPALGSPFATEAFNCLPDFIGYRNIRKIVTQGTVMPGTNERTRGIFSYIDTTGVSRTFIGTGTRLFEYGLAAWTERGSGYSMAADANWQFQDFGDFVYGAKGLGDLVRIDVNNIAAGFVATPGAPANAQAVGRVGDFLMVGVNNELVWPAINDPNTWTEGVRQAGSQVLPDGGRIGAIIGGRQPLIFQERLIRRAVYVGPPLIFDFGQIIAEDHGLLTPTAIVEDRDRIFYIARDGIYMFAGDQITPIGAGKVDKHFFRTLDQNYLSSIRMSIDPINHIVWIIYPAALNTAGVPNRYLAYNIDIGEWSEGSYVAQEIGVLYSPPLTLEELGAIYPTLEDIPYPLDSRIYSGGTPSLGFITGTAPGQTAGLMGFPTGACPPARATTGEMELIKGRQAVLYEVDPIIDAEVARMEVAVRERYGSAVQRLNGEQQNRRGGVNFKASGRYWRFTVKTQDGEEWSNMQGVEPIQVTDGGQA